MLEGLPPIPETSRPILCFPSTSPSAPLCLSRSLALSLSRSLALSLSRSLALSLSRSLALSLSRSLALSLSRSLALSLSRSLALSLSRSLALSLSRSLALSLSLLSLPSSVLALFPLVSSPSSCSLFSSLLSCTAHFSRLQTRSPKLRTLNSYVAWTFRVYLAILVGLVFKLQQTTVTRTTATGFSTRRRQGLT